MPLGDSESGLTTGTVSCPSQESWASRRAAVAAMSRVATTASVRSAVFGMTNMPSSLIVRA
ncbi:hypothetical protein GCM10010495_43440 [Kitasatospora herbaricolor]|nr:hypothetical protein GCM10010495_43440 [Kitasatospora herbaricolor]